MGERTSVVVVGYGPRGRAWTETAKQSGMSVSVVDDDPDAVARAERDGFRTSDLESALNAGPAVVVVATPPSAHLGVGRAALQHQIPTIIEKPLALTVADAQELCRHAADRDTPAYVVHNFRLRDLERAVQRGLDALPQGVVGMTIHTSRPRSGATAHEDHLAHAPLWDYGIHELDLCVARMGSAPTELQATQRGATGERRYHVAMTWADGRAADYVLTEHPTLYGHYAWLEGTTAAVRVVDRTVHVVSRQRRPQRVRLPKTPAPEGVLLEHAMKRSELSGLMVGDGLRAVEVVAAAVSSLETGQAVALQEGT